MNCINHPTAECAAYCQQCGKALCAECVRAVGGVIYCESCLAARLGMSGGGQIPAVFPSAHPVPMLAGLLGFIPGVGAMYNGQFVKALAHVLIFAIFVSLANTSSVFGILVAAWVVYQAFDAYHTAEARRAGLPLPNPFGLNDLGTWLRIPQAPAPPASTYSPGFASGTTPEAGAGPGAAREPGDAAGQPNPPSYTPPPVYPNYGTQAQATPVPPGSGSGAPVGAIVLIVLGLLLLFQSLGIFRGDWLNRSWPLLIVGAGVWLWYRRTHESSEGGPQ